MSEKPITKGDLVMIVRRMPCCGAQPEFLGLPFIVSEIRRNNLHECLLCGDISLRTVAMLGRKDLPDCGAPLSMLIRIDPHALSEDTRTDEELVA